MSARADVLLVDRGRLLGPGARGRLSEERGLLVLGGLDDLADAVELHRAEIVVLVDGPGVDEVCGKLATGRARLLVVSAEPDGLRLLALLSAGATGYVAVGEDPDALWPAVQAVVDGHSYVPPAMLGGLLHQLVQADRQQPAQQTPTGDPRFARLSRREREVLDLLAVGSDQQAIARALVISPQTARTHIQNVLGKLEVHSRLEAVALAHEHRQVGQTPAGEP